MSLLLDKLKQASEANQQNNVVNRSIKNGINSFWFPDDQTYYFSILGVVQDFQEHGIEGLCDNAYFQEPCNKCGKETQWKKKVKDRETGEEKEIVQLSKPKRNCRILAYIHNYEPVDGEPVMVASKSGKLFPASPVRVIQMDCGEANTQTGLIKDRHIEQILEAIAGNYQYEQVFQARKYKSKDPKSGKDVTTKPTAIRANDRDTLVVKTADGITHKRKVSTLKVPADILEKYGPDALTVGQQVGIILNTINGDVRWSFWEELGAVKPVGEEEPPTDEAPVDGSTENSLDN